jgi:hypothetical protein
VNPSAKVRVAHVKVTIFLQDALNSGDPQTLSGRLKNEGSMRLKLAFPAVCSGFKALT